jgi:hypothetical protein
MARPNKGLAHLDGLEGDEDRKDRLYAVLATLTGEMLVEEAYDELGVGPTQFANLRKRTLQGALDALLPRPGGRPRNEVAVSLEEVEAMRERIAELEVYAAKLRAQLEIAMLPLLKQPRRTKSRRPSKALPQGQGGAVPPE